MPNINSGLQSAKNDPKDEFYTRYEDIARELVHYKEQLKGKHVICPCDWDESLDEVVVYASEEECQKENLMQENCTVKVIDTDKTDRHIEKDIGLIKCNFIKFLIAHAEAYGIASISVSGYNPAKNLGVRFQELDYSKYDVVITNPPFSQFREFIDVMFENDLEFLVIGNQNAITYKEVFKHMKADEMWLGYGFPRNCAHFINPFYEDTASDLDHREGMIRVPGVMWFTNMDVSTRHDRMILTEEYSPERYQSYINFDGIEVGKTRDIPYDYPGFMGVPITFLSKYNPEQFEVIGSSAELAEPIADYFSKGEYQAGGPAFYTPTPTEKDQKRGFRCHREYDRIVIRNRNPRPADE